MNVSVIIPAYNSERLIGATLRSILDQDVDGLNVIVVDDGSTDRTAEVAGSFDDRVQVIRQKNAGIAIARNVGLDACTSPLIAFCDHDDLWHPFKLKAQITAFEQDAEVGVVYGEFISWNPNDRPTFPDARLDPGLRDQKLSGWIYPELLLTNWVLFSTAVFRREVFEKVGKFNPELPPSDDWDLAVRASRHFKFIKLRQAVALYRQHPHQTSRKPVARDIQSDVRDRFIQEFGLRGPDGKTVDPVQLRSRRFRNHFSHGYMAYKAGMYEPAGTSFGKAWRIQRLSFKAFAYWMLSGWRSKVGR